MPPSRRAGLRQRCEGSYARGVRLRAEAAGSCEPPRSGHIGRREKLDIFGSIWRRVPGPFLARIYRRANMVSVAVGLQARGKVPFADTFACFLSRAYDNVRMAAISRANINLCGSHCGVSIGEDGPSQMALEDIAMFRAIHGSAVFYPSDAV